MHATWNGTAAFESDATRRIDVEHGFPPDAVNPDQLDASGPLEGRGITARSKSREGDRRLVVDGTSFRKEAIDRFLTRIEDEQLLRPLA